MPLKWQLLTLIKMVIKYYRYLKSYFTPVKLILGNGGQILKVLSSPAVSNAN